MKYKIMNTKLLPFYNVIELHKMGLKLYDKMLKMKAVSFAAEIYKTCIAYLQKLSFK